MRAEDLFAAEDERIELGHVHVRKGTVAAFAHNALTLERADPAGAEYAQALADLRETIPTLRAAGLFEVFAVRVPTAARIVAQEANASADGR